MKQTEDIKICISILNWNNAADTLSCLQSLKSIQQLYCDVVVLDNGSTDNSLTILRNSTGFELIESPVNLGFAGGHNLVIQNALKRGYDYVWLLNNDSVVEHGCLEQLVAAGESNLKCALLSPIIRSRQIPHDIQHAVSILNDTGTGVVEFTEIARASQVQEANPSKVILWGTALLIKVDAIRKIGFLDEKLFAYSEDTDLCLRSLQNGYENIAVFDAHILHESPPHPRKPHYYYYTQRNATLMWRKYVSTAMLLKLVRWNMQLARKHLISLSNDPIAAAALIQGIWHGWIGRGGAYLKDDKMTPFSYWLVRILMKYA